ncbi:hypothetical protein [Nocardia cyriacigeorgica]|uniref:hypothetical protein n=1 Tax=Nocardia cyriacigeorgica TaxID=135487 RepID=UPI0018936A43|nr:hypothetical protein [Nocardia cyriacigeorgica]MBF6416941.1 hypothetical protein [Nocardia cyriacigeorgica]
MTAVRITIELPDRRIDIMHKPEYEFTADVPEQVADGLLAAAVADVRAALHERQRKS